MTPARRKEFAASARRPPIQGGNGWSDSRQPRSRWRQRCIGIAACGAETIVLLDFWSPTCGPCMQMKPTVESLVNAGYPIRQVDVSREPELAQQYNVTGIPCFVMLVDGQEVDRVVGATSSERLQQMFTRAQGSGRIAAARSRAVGRQSADAEATETVPGGVGDAWLVARSPSRHRPTADR